jgi:hypothetical protein
MRIWPLSSSDFSGEVEPKNNGWECALRPAPIQCKVTNGFPANGPRIKTPPCALRSTPLASRAPSPSGPSSRQSRLDDEPIGAPHEAGLPTRDQGHLAYQHSMPCWDSKRWGKAHRSKPVRSQTHTPILGCGNQPSAQMTDGIGSAGFCSAPSSMASFPRWRRSSINGGSRAIFSRRPS